MVQQSATPPDFHRNLPVPEALWTDFEIDGVSHHDVVAVVVSGSGVCGAVPANAPQWTLKLKITDEVGGANPTDLLCGLTLFTFPSLRWRDLGIVGSLIDPQGEERATATGESSVLTVISWPFALIAKARAEGEDLFEKNYRALARHVIAELVQHHERLRALAALAAIDKSIEAEVDAARAADPVAPLAPIAPIDTTTDPLRGDTNQPPSED